MMLKPLHPPMSVDFAAPAVRWNGHACRVVNVWALDPAWNRIEWCDEQGESLGVITFERRQPLDEPGWFSQLLQALTKPRLAAATNG